MTHRTISATLAVLAAAATSLAQSDAGRLHPVPGPVHDGGTLDLATGSWRWSSQARFAGRVYDNRCQWLGGLMYQHPEHCEDIYDEGRVPSPSDPAAPAGAEVDNWIDGFQIAYCTPFPTGSVDIRIAFWDHLGGDCVGWLPQRAIVPATAYNGAAAYFDLSGLGLPGDNSGGGKLSCWSVTIALDNTPGGGFCLLSDGDGTWDGSGDEFNWSFQHEMDNATYGGIPSGPVAGGEPAVAAAGSCTYSIPCSTDPFGNTCGTGLGGADMFWLNTDGCSPGAASCTGVPPGSCSGGYVTGCYWFGGYPSYPFSSYWLALTSPGSCQGSPGCDPPVFYCRYADSGPGACGQAQCPSSSGCKATIYTSPIASQPVTGANDYDVGVVGSEINKPGIVFYGFGAASVPFASGSLCIQPPIKRTPVQSTANQGAACTGRMALRINDPGEPAGTRVFYQAWLRDPASTAGTDVSDAVEVLFAAAAEHLGECPGSTPWTLTSANPGKTIVFSAGEQGYRVENLGPGVVAVSRTGLPVTVLDPGKSVRFTASLGDLIDVDLTSGPMASGHSIADP